MTKNFMHLAILACISCVSINAMAANHTVSLGYAQAKAEEYEDLKGVNAQYRYETQSAWGVVASSSYLTGDDEYNFRYGKGEIDGKYFSLLAGPSYRFNEYVSAYALAGLANIKVSYDEYDFDGSYNYSEDTSNTSFAYGLGVTVNPVENIAVNLGYEGTTYKDHGNDAKFNGFNIGVGYKF